MGSSEYYSNYANGQIVELSLIAQRSRLRSACRVRLSRPGSVTNLLYRATCDD